MSSALINNDMRQKLFYGWLFLIGMLVTGCDPQALAVLVTPGPTPGRIIHTDTFEGVIFSQEQVEQMGLERMLGRSISGYWTPAQDQVQALEEKLDSYLQQAAPQTYPGPLRPLGEYNRQYMGLLVNGQRVIFTNFFCNPHDHDWQHEFVLVMDGGSCYFELKYDVQTGALYDLSIHGES